MAFIPLPFGIKVVVAWETGSGVAICVHFVSKDAPNPVNATDLQNAVDSFNTWGVAVRPLQAANITRVGVQAYDWSIPNGATLLMQPTVSQFGTNASPVAPLNVAVVASHRTPKTGRSFRGRNYIPGIGENAISTGDIINATLRNALVTAYASLVTNLNADGLVLVTASFYANGAPRVTGVGTAVNSTVVDQYSDSQRRRLAGRGA